VEGLGVLGGDEALGRRVGLGEQREVTSLAPFLRGAVDEVVGELHGQGL